ncbi:MAG TPA: ATP-binding cassette domain-containing protein, partial [Thermomicrobiales bacterium]|nr:ATP-binding cassette domain-containing protein [Thermomicrobiales bacterium]
MARFDRNATPLVEVREITKSYGNVRALRGVSMAVHAGEVHCLLGDNGAGKSTLIKVLSGAHQPDTGEMYIEGKPVRFSSPR